MSLRRRVNQKRRLHSARGAHIGPAARLTGLEVHPEIDALYPLARHFSWPIAFAMLSVVEKEWRRALQTHADIDADIALAAKTRASVLVAGYRPSSSPSFLACHADVSARLRNGLDNTGARFPDASGADLATLTVDGKNRIGS